MPPPHEPEFAKVINKAKRVAKAETKKDCGLRAEGRVPCAASKTAYDASS